MSRLLKHLLVGVFLAALLLPAVMPALAQDAVGSVLVPNLNVRSGPGTQYGAIFTLPYSFGVRMLARNSEANWVLIQLTDGRQGWVNVNYLYTSFRIWDLPVGDFVPASPITPTAVIDGVVSLEMYEFPSAGSRIVGGIPLGATVALLGRDYSFAWAQVKYGEVTGWVREGNLIATVPIRSLAPADGSVIAPMPSGGFINTPDGQGGGGGITGQIHVVAAGETLGKIAEAYGVDVYRLAAFNRISNINLIYSGQQLYIPPR